MKQYTIAGPQRAYDTSIGGTVKLDPNDPGVQANIAAGVIIAGAPGQDAEPTTMACPACTEEGKTRPPKFESQAELDAHYDEKHPALVAPSMKDGE